MIFVDTSGMFAALSPRDRNHHLAARLIEGGDKLLIHSTILTELVALADARRENRTRTLIFIEAICDSPDYDVIWLDESDHRESLALLQSRPDKRYSLSAMPPASF